MAIRSISGVCPFENVDASPVVSLGVRKPTAFFNFTVVENRIWWSGVHVRCRQFSGKTFAVFRRRSVGLTTIESKTVARGRLTPFSLAEFVVDRFFVTSNGFSSAKSSLPLNRPQRHTRPPFPNNSFARARYG